MALIKRLIGLAKQKAPLNQYYLEIGAHFLKKGATHKVGEVISRKRTLTKDRVQVKVVTDMFFSFKDNRISQTTTKMVVNESDIESSR